MDRFFDRLDERWRTLPLEKQQQYTLYILLGYLLLTVAVIFKVWYDARKSNHYMVIGHIENPILNKKGSPALLKDTLSKK